MRPKLGVFFYQTALALSIIILYTVIIAGIADVYCFMEKDLKADNIDQYESYRITSLSDSGHGITEKHKPLMVRRRLPKRLLYINLPNAKATLCQNLCCTR